MTCTPSLNIRYSNNGIAAMKNRRGSRSSVAGASVPLRAPLP